MKIVFLDDKDSKNALKTMIAIAIQMSIEYPFRSFIMSVDYISGGLQQFFKPKEGYRVAENHDIKRTKGMDYLVKRQLEGMLEKRDFEKAFVAVMDYHLYYLPSEEVGCEQVYVNRMKKTCELAEKLEKYGDVIFINGGNYMNAWNSKLVDDADLVVISEDYNDSRIENLFVGMPATIREKVVFIMPEWLEVSRGEDRLKKQLRLEERRISTIPYNAAFMRAYLQGQASDFLAKNNRIPASIECRYYIKKLKEATKRLLMELEMV